MRVIEKGQPFPADPAKVALLAEAARRGRGWGWRC
jgi:hypothetical protein